MEQQITFKTDVDLKKVLATQYMKQITNFFADEKQALKFLSAVVGDVQRNQKLLECTPTSIINAYITIAQLGLMPSSTSGEAYVLPYQNSKKDEKTGVWYKEMEAQPQIGYQGWVTLFYKAGVTKIFSEIVREKDKVSFLNGEVNHEIDVNLSQKERGKAIGAYCIVFFRGERMVKYMNGKDIVDYAKRFSKSYDPAGKFSPWNPLNDPELWMWKKTVLKQHAKLLPKNETIYTAVAIDNTDSNLQVRLDSAKEEAASLTMGSKLLPMYEKKEEQNTPSGAPDEGAKGDDIPDEIRGI